MNNSLEEVHPELVSEWSEENISVTETSTSFYNERQKVQVSLSKADIIEPVSGHEKGNINSK